MERRRLRREIQRRQNSEGVPVQEPCGLACGHCSMWDFQTLHSVCPEADSFLHGSFLLPPGATSDLLIWVMEGDILLALCQLLSSSEGYPDSRSSSVTLPRLSSWDAVAQEIKVQSTQRFDISSPHISCYFHTGQFYHYHSFL